jgi:flagellar hook-length control protein FliK
MPDIQMILEAPQAVQGSGPAASQGADGGEVFGKALSQAKSTIDEKSADSARGKKDSPDSARSEKAAESKGSHKAKARRQEEGMPKLPTRQPSEKPATVGAQSIETPADKRGTALAEPAPSLKSGLKSRREAWAEVGLGLPDSLSEGTPLQFWRGDEPSATDNPPTDDKQDPELAIMIQQIVNNVIGDAMPAFVPPEIVHYEAAIQEEAEAPAQLGDQPVNAASGKSVGPNDIWYDLEEGWKGSVEAAKTEESGANTIATPKAEHNPEHAEKIAFRPAVENANSANVADGEDGARANGKSADQPTFYSAEDLQAMTRRPKKKSDAPQETAVENAQNGKSEKTQKQGQPSDAEVADAKAKANPHHRTQQAGDKSLADAELALGLRHEMTAGSEENAKTTAHFRNGQPPREIESALPKDNKGQVKGHNAGQGKQADGQEKIVIAKEASEAIVAKSHLAQGEEASAARAAQNRHAKASSRTQIMESEEGQNNNAQTEKSPGEARHAGHRRGASSAKEAAEEAAARRSANENGAPVKSPKEPGKSGRGPRHGQTAPSGQDSLNAKASEAAKPAPPPMRMDAAPQSRAKEEANAGSKAAQNSGQNNSSGQNSQGAQSSQASQTSNGGPGSQNSQNSGNTLGGQNSSSNQGQGSFAAHRGAGEGEMADAKPGAAQAKPSDVSASHGSQSAAVADSKSTIPGGSVLGGTGHAQGHAQGQAMPGAPALPGSTEHQQAHAPANGKPQLPPQAPMAQMDGSVKWMLRNDQQSAEIQLYPEHLGKVTIRLRVEGNEVHARVWASEASTLPALREHRTFLESSLKEQGLQLSSFDLQHGKGGQQAQSGEGQNRPQGQNFHFGAQMIESWNGSEFRQELPAQVASQVAAPTQNGGRVELYA